MKSNKNLRYTLAAFLCFFCFSAVCRADDAASSLWRDPDQPIPQRVQSLVAQLTMKEKISLCYWLAPAIDRLGIKAYHHGNEALHGVVRPGNFTVFPQAIGLAATFDPPLVHDMASAISDEARAKWNMTHGNHLGDFSDVLVFWSPVVNMARDPRWGRTQETYGEDPWLTGRLGVAFVTGLQGNDPHYLKVISTPKHFAANNQEAGRFGKNIVADERFLQEYELAGFRACITEGHAQSIMASYTSINGVPSSANQWLLTDVLRKQWGFTGYVVSDCGAVSHVVDAHHFVKTPEEAAAACFNAGLDMEGGYFADYPDVVDNYMQKAIDRGLIQPQVIDAAVSRVLTGRFKLGMFDPPDRVPYSKIPPTAIGSAEHIALARKLADESMVLLKNSRIADAPLLPIDPTAIKKIVVTGPWINQAQFGDYGGSPTITPVTPYDGIAAHAKQLGIDISQIDWKTLKDARNHTSIASADLVIAVVGLSTADEIEGIDRATISLAKEQEDLLKTLLAENPKTVVVLESGSSVAIPWLAENIPAIVQAWYPGEEGGAAIADVLFGDYNPSGRLPLTFYASDAQLRPMEEYDITRGRTYMYVKDVPTYAFGHGLSYTSFQYDPITLSSPSASRDAVVKVSVKLTNTGNRDGSEVVQCYVHTQTSSVPMPIRQLWAFQKIFLRKGQSKTVDLELETKNFGHWDKTKQSFLVEPGKFDIEVGAASDDIRQTAVLEITP